MRSIGTEWAVSRKVFGGCGGAVAYRRHMLEEIGFLDTDFFIFFEDVDLSFRAQLRGHQCIFLPQAIVYHRYRATTKKGPAVFCSQRNIELVYLKNMPMGLIFRSLPQRLMYEVGAAIYFTKSGSGRAFLRGKLDVLRHLPSTLRKRKEIQSRKTVSSLGASRNNAKTGVCQQVEKVSRRLACGPREAILRNGHGSES